MDSRAGEVSRKLLELVALKCPGKNRPDAYTLTLAFTVAEDLKSKVERILRARLKLHREIEEFGLEGFDRSKVTYLAQFLMGNSDLSFLPIMIVEVVAAALRIEKKGRFLSAKQAKAASKRIQGKYEKVRKQVPSPG